MRTKDGFCLGFARRQSPIRGVLSTKGSPISLDLRKSKSFGGNVVIDDSLYE